MENDKQLEVNETVSTVEDYKYPVWYRWVFISLMLGIAIPLFILDFSGRFFSRPGFTNFILGIMLVITGVFFYRPLYSYNKRIVEEWYTNPDLQERRRKYQRAHRWALILGGGINVVMAFNNIGMSFFEDRSIESLALLWSGLMVLVQLGLTVVMGVFAIQSMKNRPTFKSKFLNELNSPAGSIIFSIVLVFVLGAIFVGGIAVWILFFV